jgi:ABC-2 type transport system ATP-binding protein
MVPSVAAALQARGLIKRFETVLALDGVGLEVAEGEVRGLLGPNGAGKTTLLRILFGLVRADAGEVRLRGSVLDPARPFALDGVAGFVEEPAFYPYLSGRANLELLAELDGTPDRGQVAEALDRVGLGSRGEDRVSGYSTGMRQRLGIAACLLRRPRLLLLDEPTSGLDPGGLRDIQLLVGELAADGVAIVLSSHQISELDGVCHAYTIVRRGRVVWDGSAQALRDQVPAGAYRLRTSDDERALGIAAGRPGVQAARSAQGGLELSVEESFLDPFTVALGRAGVAIRALEQLASPLEELFFSLTADAPAPAVPAPEHPGPAPVAAP